MPEPLIGLTTYHTQSKSGLPTIAITEAYIQAIIRAGAIPVLIPLDLTSGIITRLISRLDGILFSGGGDIQPDTYGSQPHPLVTDVDTNRDEVELALLRATVKSGLPFLGICRGIQLINVGFGGTLYEDILDQHPHALRHDYFPEYPRNYRAHNVNIEIQSQLGRILNRESLQVNSMHHQGIRELGKGLQPTATAPDELIEAVELHDYPFGIAVQWHPEWMNDDSSMDGLFRAFVQAAITQS